MKRFREPRARKLQVLSLAVLIVSAIPALTSAQQMPGKQVPGLPQDAPPIREQTNNASMTVQVSVRDLSGMPLPNSALVRLFSMERSVSLTTETVQGGMASFANIASGEYEIEVTSVGYKTASERASIMGSGSNLIFYIYLHGENEPASLDRTTGRPIVTPKLQELIDKGLAKMRRQQWEDALKTFDKALKLTPRNPDIYYLQGMTYVGMKDQEGAKKCFETALSISPSHERSLLALGEMQLRSGDAKAAVQTLDKAYQANGADWRAHLLLANAYFQTGEYDRAQLHANRAIELDKAKSAPAVLLKVNILAVTGRQAEALQTLDAAARDFPNDPTVAAERNRIAALKPANNVTELSVTGAASSAPTEKAPAPAAIVDAPPNLLAATTRAAAIVRTWAPPDIDAKEYALALDVACPLEDVLDRAQRRMKLQVDNFEKFTAVELISSTNFDMNGNPQAPREKSFSYMVTLIHSANGITYLEESRNGGENVYQFPTAIATKGLVGIGVAVLDRNFQNDFNFRCDGLAKWRGKPAWVLRFEQKPGVPSRIMSWRDVHGSHPVALRGKVWVGANTYELLHLETDLKEPLPELELALNHLTIDYGPVHFEHGNTDLWLPWHADAFIEYRTKRLHNSHTLTNYLLFSVDTTHKVSNPTPPPEEPQ